MPARELTAQVAEVMRHQRVLSVKVGALGGRENVRAVARLLAKYPDVPVVVDTPILPTRGKARLLAAGALEALKTSLLPRATLVTVNVDEAQRSARRARSLRQRGARRRASARAPRATRRAVKGGHLTGAHAIDVLAVDGEVIELRARRLAIAPTHGSGCTFASLIAGRLAVRPSRAASTASALVGAIRWAKRVHHAALARTVDVGTGLRVIVFSTTSCIRS